MDNPKQEKQATRKTKRPVVSMHGGAHSVEPLAEPSLPPEPRDYYKEAELRMCEYCHAPEIEHYYRGNDSKPHHFKWDGVAPRAPEKPQEPRLKYVINPDIKKMWEADREKLSPELRAFIEQAANDLAAVGNPRIGAELAVNQTEKPERCEVPPLSNEQPPSPHGSPAQAEVRPGKSYVHQRPEMSIHVLRSKNAIYRLPRKVSAHKTRSGPCSTPRASPVYL